MGVTFSSPDIADAQSFFFNGGPNTLNYGFEPANANKFGVQATFSTVSSSSITGLTVNLSLKSWPFHHHDAQRSGRFDEMLTTTARLDLLPKSNCQCCQNNDNMFSHHCLQWFYCNTIITLWYSERFFEARSCTNRFPGPERRCWDLLRSRLHFLDWYNTR